MSRQYFKALLGRCEMRKKVRETVKEEKRKPSSRKNHLRGYIREYQSEQGAFTSTVDGHSCTVLRPSDTREEHSATRMLPSSSIFCFFLLLTGHRIGARPTDPALADPDQQQLSEDPSARYEIYVPDGKGQMAQQMLTLSEIRTLLARQSDQPHSYSPAQYLTPGGDHSSLGSFDDDVRGPVELYDSPQLVSLEGGKRVVESIIPAEGVDARIENGQAGVDVGDVISSVRTIMASQMAQREQQPKPVVVMADSSSAASDEEGKPKAEEKANAAAASAPLLVSEGVESNDASVAERPMAAITVIDPPAKKDDQMMMAKTDGYPADAEHHHHHEGEHHGHHEEGGDHHHHHHEGDHHGHHEGDHHHHHHGDSHPAVVFDQLPQDNLGLLATNQHQDQELSDLALSSNRLAFQVWSNAVKERSIENNEVFSPLALTSALGISFLGARGTTAEAIDSVLGLDRLTSRNPHLHLQQVSQDLDPSQHFQSSQSHTVYVDSSKGGKVDDIFRARLDTLYGASTAGNASEVQRIVQKTISTASEAGSVEQVDTLRSPFGIISTASLNVAWPSFTVPANQEEEYLQFLNLPSAAQVASGRRLMPVPTIRTTGDFYAGYDEELDATTVAIPLHPVREKEEDGPIYRQSSAPAEHNSALDQAGHMSLVVVMPGSASKFAAGGSGLAALEAKLAERPDGWDHLLRQTKPYHLQVEMPQLLDQHSRFSLNEPLSSVQPNLANLFDSKLADFGAVSSNIKPVYLADLIQLARLNISSVATLPGGHGADDEVSSRAGDSGKGKNGKRASSSKPTKVEVTVKTPCQVAADHMVSKPSSTTLPPPGQKRPTTKTTTTKPATFKTTTIKPAPRPASTKKPAVQPKTTTKPTTTIRTTTTTRRPTTKKTASTAAKKTQPNTTARPKVPSTTTVKTTPKPTTTTAAASKKPQVKTTPKPTTTKSVTKKASPNTTARPKTTSPPPNTTSKTTTPRTTTTTAGPVKKQQSSAKPSGTKPTSPAKTTTTVKPTTKKSATTTKPTLSRSTTTAKPAVRSTTTTAKPSKRKPDVTTTTTKPTSTTRKTITTTTTGKPAKRKPGVTTTTAKPTTRTTTLPAKKAPPTTTTAKPNKRKPDVTTTTAKPTTRTTTPRTTTAKRTPPTTKKTTTTVKPSKRKPEVTTTTTTRKPTTRRPPSGTTTTKKPAPKTTPQTTPFRCPLTTPQPPKRNDNTTKPTKPSKKDENKKKTKRQAESEAEHHHPHPQHVSFNRAFLYAVRHNPTGLLLMMGRYVHP